MNQSKGHRSGARKPLPGDDSTPRGGLGEGAIYGLLGYQLAQAAIVTTHAFECEVGGPLGLRPVEFTILQLVRENPAVSATSLSRALDITVPGVKVWIDRLMARALVQREVRDADRRSFALVLTPQGDALLQQALQRLLAADDALLEPLSPGERALLLELLHKVARSRAIEPVL